MWNANRTIAKTKQNNSFAVAVMVLPLLSVVFYDFRLNGNWGVRSMFPHIHVYYSRIETGISFISKVKKKKYEKGREWAERVGSSFYLSLCLNHQPAAPEMMEQTFTQVESDNRHRRHSVARVTTTLLFLLFFWKKKQKTNSAGAANRKREGSLTSLPWQSNLLY